ncbi:MAG: rane protein-like protein [Frankiales bacterium]|nr:rane protein-like protein [Frankiales bacterium]
MSPALAGAGGLPPFGALTVLTEARPPLLPTLAIVLTGAVYLYGVRRLTGRGDAWSAWRTVAFVVGGLGVLAIALCSGLERYDGLLFGAHMVQHMLLSMVAPVFLALGAPVTLALRTLPSAPRGRLLAVLHSRLAKVVTFPAIPWLLFIGSPFALYFSGWYAATLTSPLLHDLLHLHFVLVGCLFFWPILGVDPVPGRVSHPFRILMLFASMPFHAFLGVAIMSVTADGHGLIATPQYLARGLTLDQAVFQQQVGGGLIWSSGDIVGLLFIFVAVAQWMRASDREAAREDRRLDRLEAAGQP